MFAFANALVKRDISRAIAHPLVSTLKKVVVTTVVSSTLLRAGQGECLAFVFANETGHKPSHCAPSSTLKEVVVTSVTTVVSLTLLRAGQGECLAFANALAKRNIIGFAPLR